MLHLHNPWKGILPCKTNPGKYPLEVACAEVMQTPEFDAEAFEAQVERIDVCEGIQDAHTETYIWKDPSRRNSWTDEMEARAAEHARKRFEGAQSATRREQILDLPCRTQRLPKEGAGR